MKSRLYRVAVLALYQLSILLGIVLLPVALAAKRAGVPIPVGRLVDRLDTAYERTAER